MGTTAFWAMADLMPEVTESLVSLMVGLAPISVCGQMSGPVRCDNYRKMQSQRSLKIMMVMAGTSPPSVARLRG